MESVIPFHFIQIVTAMGVLATGLSCAMAAAPSGLPAPSRTIYKCQVKGAVSYSDEPCPGAQRLDATPVSGVTHLSGSPRTGKDVANELHQQQFAEALRPLSGMDASQLATYTRRNALAPAAQRECRQIEPVILQLEQSEHRADAVSLKPIQQDLYMLRKRYKTLGC